MDEYFISIFFLSNVKTCNRVFNCYSNCKDFNDTSIIRHHKKRAYRNIITKFRCNKIRNLSTNKILSISNQTDKVLTKDVLLVRSPTTLPKKRLTIEFLRHIIFSHFRTTGLAIFSIIILTDLALRTQLLNKVLIDVQIKNALDVVL